MVVPNREGFFMGSLFDFTHVAYIVLSLSISVALLWWAKTRLKDQRRKDAFLKTFGFLTFFLHISVLWVDFLNDGSAGVPDNVIFPIYFCNASMYLLMLASIWEQKQTKAFHALAVVTGYAGFFGATISLFYPAYYLGASSIFEWGVFKSMLSHSTMWIGAVWLLVGGYVRIERKNVLTYFGGLLCFGAVGVMVNLIFRWAGLHEPNAMYLQHPPLAEAPILSAYTISFLMLLLIFGFVELVNRARTKRA